MKNLYPTPLRAAVLPVLCLALLFSSSAAQETLLTRAEATGFLETSLHADVMDFITQLQQESSLVRLEMMGTSTEGREIPLLIIGDPVPSSPADLRLDGRMPVYIQANIHAGEVEGKEASLMLARDILRDKNRPYLDKLVLLIAPIFNADGNEKLGKNRRDNGPELAGIRYNGMNLDLNRDGLKQESPELEALTLNVLNRWDPAVMVDCHTTNGSYHDEPVTYLWQLNPNGDKELLDYMRDVMMPKIDETLENKYRTVSIPYGNYISQSDPEKGWSPAGPEPRYLTNYIGLRNRMAILLENYAYADFKTRVWGNYHFLLSVLDYSHAHRDTIHRLLSDADQRTIRRGLNPAADDSVGINFELQKLGRDIQILGYELDEYTDERGRTRYRKSDRKRTYTVPLYHDWIKKESTARPYAYLISSPDPGVLENLIQHGIVVERLGKAATLQVESFEVSALNPRQSPYQGHYINDVSGSVKKEEVRFGAGTLFITTAQPLGNVVCALLEPRANDGLVAWNFFDRYLTRQWGGGVSQTPIYKLYDRAPLVKQIIR